MLLNILQCTGHFLAVRNYPQPSMLRNPDLWVTMRGWSETSENRLPSDDVINRAFKQEMEGCYRY